MICDRRIAAAVAPNAERDLLRQRTGGQEDRSLLPEFARDLRLKRRKPRPAPVSIERDIGTGRLREALERLAWRFRFVVRKLTLRTRAKKRELVVSQRALGF
jgi:hypothetical protein